MHLQLVHQSAGVTPLPTDSVVWRTCLREVAFVDEEAQVATTRPLLTGGEAYALLVEIVSGLRSPLVGETEVQAQFKQFLASLDPATHGSLRRLGQRVLRDAKQIRRQFLQGFGAHSYGRLAVRHIRAGARVVVIGTGALAAEVMSALGSDVEVDQWGRAVKGQTPRRPASHTFHLFSSAAAWPQPSESAAALVIAAPVSQEDLDRVIGCYARLTAVVDLRAAVERTPLNTAAPVATLDDLFAEARASEDPAMAGRVHAARAEIVRLSRAYDLQEELHPFGWDDVCA